MRKHAKTISSIGTDPLWVLVWLIVLGYIFLSRYSVTTEDFLGMIILTVWTFTAGLILRKTLNLESKDRRYRTYLLSAITAGWICVSLIYWEFFSAFFQEALLIAFFIIVVLTIINVFYRISFHVGLSTSLLILVNHFSGWILLPLFLIVPLIGWSRVELNKHTVAQVIAGFLVPFVVYFLLMTTIFN